MNQQKIVRTVCAFSKNPNTATLQKLTEVTDKLEKAGFLVQTKRVCSTYDSLHSLQQMTEAGIEYVSVGSITLHQANEMLPVFYQNKALTFNVEIGNEAIGMQHVELLQNIIQNNASKTFNFTYTFNNAKSSPYFPSAVYEKDGFAIGLQPTDLSVDCATLEEWLQNTQKVWQEIAELFQSDVDFLGIDSSVAPLLSGNSSFVNFLRRLDMSFERSTTTNVYTTITKFIKQQNPKPVGLCGMMLPCLEDFELTEEYEKGNFSIERNIYLSLHSGLGIDTYPIGINEKPERVIEILQLLQALSSKYNKPLSARFVSDGMATIGDMSVFKNPYLKDCVIRSI